MNITDEEYEKYIRFYLDTTLSCDIDIFARPPQGRDRSKVMFTNMVKHIKNASKEKGYLFSNPMLAAWNITSACNFRCEHCLYSGQEYSSKDDLTTEQALNLADELIDAGVAFVINVNGMNIYHAGDLNWWNAEGRGELYGEVYGREYKRALKPVINRHFDLGFVVLDSRMGEEGYFLGLEHFVKNFECDYIFPMHMWGQYQGIERFKNRPGIANLNDRIIDINLENMIFEIED